MTMIRVSNAGVSVLNGIYESQPFTTIPNGFARTCQKMGWNSISTWNQLAVPQMEWFQHETNGSYIYLHNDGRWWMDDPSGAGVYVCPHPAAAAKTTGTVPRTGWELLANGVEPMPQVEHVEEGMEKTRWRKQKLEQ